MRDLMVIALWGLIYLLMLLGLAHDFYGKAMWEAIKSYQGLIGAVATIFAGWLAWSATHKQMDFQKLADEEDRQRNERAAKLRLLFELPVFVMYADDCVSWLLSLEPNEGWLGRARENSTHLPEIKYEALQVLADSAAWVKDKKVDKVISKLASDLQVNGSRLNGLFDKGETFWIDDISNYYEILFVIKARAIQLIGYCDESRYDELSVCLTKSEFLAAVKHYENYKLKLGQSGYSDEAMKRFTQLKAIDFRDE